MPIRRRLKRLLPRALRCLIVAVSAAGYLAAVIGLPFTPMRKPSGPAFPCQNHPCGCATAEQCWADCCCFTREERLAWARQERVEIPEHLLAWHTPRQRDLEACCSQACGHPCGACAHKGEKRSEETTEPTENGWVLGSLASKCRGLATLWLTLGVTAPPPPLFARNTDQPMVDSVSLDDSSAASLSLSPPTPPPRG